MPVKLSTALSSIPGKYGGRKRFVNGVIRAYCHACVNGKDPKYSGASWCPVCPGAGVIQVTPRVVVCKRCAGSGRTEGDLICLTYNGVGVVSVRLEAGICPRCGGTGEEGIFLFNVCKGLGII